MKLGQVANKKVISTFVCCMCFLLALYCTLSQVTINSLGKLKASSSEVFAEKIEEDIIDTNKLIKKESNLTERILTYAEMTMEQRQAALSAGTLKMEYSALYTYESTRLTLSKGAQYFNGHKETYYSERVLPGISLNIPGRHVADDGTVRDGDGYICVAADTSYLSRGSVVLTSLGPAKVYDTGCAYGVIDIYVNW